MEVLTSLRRTVWAGLAFAECSKPSLKPSRRAAMKWNRPPALYSTPCGEPRAPPAPAAHGRPVWSSELSDTILQHFDPHYGGFGNGPKFPHSASIDLLLERYQATHEPQLLLAAQTTLEKMARGGVYDQLGGGFHRYSVDERWLVPHFEKMSYDNSELLKNYLHGYAVTHNPLFRETALGIIRWIDTTLSDRERGGFYASQDADVSLDDDGDYFTWTLDEVRAVLKPELSRVIELYYDVGPRGEMHHNPAKNVLWVAREPQTIAEALGTSARMWQERLKRRATNCLPPGINATRPTWIPRFTPTGTRC